MASTRSIRHPDPAWRGRVTATIVSLVILYPLLVASEFRPWIMLDADSLRAAGMFLGDFLTPSVDPEFLALVVRETWITVYSGPQV